MVMMDSAQTTSLQFAESPTLDWCRLLRHHEALRGLQSEYEAASSQISEIGMGFLARRPLSDHTIDGLSTMDQVKSVLTGWGEPDLATRIAYFASDEDLADDEKPLTMASAREFLKFFGASETEGVLDLACTPEGWIFAQWEFNDLRSAGVWFRDDHQVIFAATGSDGCLVSIEGYGEIASRIVVLEALVKAGIFTWYPDLKVTTSSILNTMSPDIMALGSLRRTVDLLGRLFDYEKGTSSPTGRSSRSTGWNTSTLSTGLNRSKASAPP
ncbi:MAG: hypothetical protein OXL37_06810 [Chloroflexota bacterium]|nr:hypothetical protein [Chloroflexota bacterium]MDE2960791.1 hypothetical protein [Chloroflexota bacterium]